MKVIYFTLIWMFSFCSFAVDFLQPKDYSHDKNFLKNVYDHASGYLQEQAFKERLQLKAEEQKSNRLLYSFNNYVPYGSCVESVCNKLGTWGCKDDNSIYEVARMCIRNYSDECINAACDKLGSFGCNRINKVRSMAFACRRNYGADCFNSVCDLLGAFGCDEMFEVTQVGRMCADVYDGGCVRFICDKLSYFACDELSELRKVALACREY